jgi:hypothetical protein
MGRKDGEKGKKMIDQVKWFSPFRIYFPLSPHEVSHGFVNWII